MANFLLSDFRLIKVWGVDLASLMVRAEEGLNELRSASGWLEEFRMGAMRTEVHREAELSFAESEYSLTDKADRNTFSEDYRKLHMPLAIAPGNCRLIRSR